MVGDEARGDAPPLIYHIWDFLRRELEKADVNQMTVGVFMMKTNETTIAVFWKDHVESELKTRDVVDILG